MPVENSVKKAELLAASHSEVVRASCPRPGMAKVAMTPRSWTQSLSGQTPSARNGLQVSGHGRPRPSTMTGCRFICDFLFFRVCEGSRLISPPPARSEPRDALSNLARLPSKGRQPHNLPALRRGLVSANSRARPIDGLINVRERRPFFHDAAHEFVDQVGVRSTVATALDEREMGMVAVVNTPGGKPLDGSGQKVGIIRNLDAAWPLSLVND